MKRAISLGLPIVLFLFFWSFFLSNSENNFLQYSPIYLVFGFGFYSLLDIFYGVLTFKDCPDAYYQLCEEIKTAKFELSKKGIMID